ncbi:GntR family transcriptional regulator [Corynebacterium riegelii]|uniref:GntR family transcriptional regulator n=1 Tax=Corynebacterium riegelii TaxID=156976 RepID=UPI00191FB4C6|nr:GntR family transcriptional regulator [Corynebacterium riegelii]QQU84072.1 GntR family transcriptional regulator [Corynebacterium riegelii]
MTESVPNTPLRRPQQHQEIASYLRDEIFAGRIPVGKSLPSEAELCEQFATSRGPVRQAVATLRSEGLISSGRGRRSIVLSNTRTESFEEVLCTASRVTQMGKIPGQVLQEFGLHQANDHIAEALWLNDTKTVVTLRRIRTANDHPVVVEEIYFSPSISSTVLSVDPNAESFHRELMRNGVNYNNISRKARVAPATEEHAEALQLPVGAPLLEIELRAFTHTGAPVEYSVQRYSTEQLTFGLNIVRGHSSPLWIELEPEQIG